MTGSSRLSRRTMRQRRKRLLAATLCAASFFGGQFLFGSDGVHSPTSAAVSQGQTLESLPKSGAKALRPAALQAVSEAPVAEPDMAPRPREQRPVTAAKSVSVTTKAEPKKLAPPEPKKVAVQPPSALPPADAKVSVTPKAETVEEPKLAPIVPAWAMPRPNKSNTTPTALPAVEATKTAAGSPLRIDLGRAQPANLPAAPPLPTTSSLLPPRNTETRAATERLASWPKPSELKSGAAGANLQTSGAKPMAPAPAWLSSSQGPQQPPAELNASAMAADPSETSRMPEGQAAPLPLEIQNPNFGKSAAAFAAVEAVQAKPALVETAVPASLPVEPVAQVPASLPAPAKAEPTAEAMAKASSTVESGVKKADFEIRALAEQPAALAPFGVREEDLGTLPANSPFEAVEQSGTVKLRVRRSVLLRTKVDVYRTAIVDEAVCDIVQFTPREVSIIGRSVGQTHITFWLDDPGSAPITYLVEVLPDPQQIKADENKYELLQNVINEMFPDSKVYLVLVADKLLVKGQAKDSEEAAQIMNIVRAQASGVAPLGGVPGVGLAQGLATPVLSAAATGGAPATNYQVINMLRVPGIQQVALKVKIAELNRSAARGFGVDAKAAINFSDSAKTTQLFLASMLNASGTATPGGINTGGTSVVTSFGGQEVNIGLRYLQERGVIRLLSEPTLVTLSGRPATFIAGGEFAVPTIVGSVGLNAVTTDFRAFGAIISFLPTVVDKDRIRLQVAPEFSQINTSLTSSNNTPGLNVRAATTTVEMREGQTLAIAGLLEDTYKATTVGDLPGLAKLFGRRDTARSETELIILVTPELVHPMEPEEVPPLPGFDVTEPTGAQFFLHGDIEGNPTKDHRSTVWPRLKRRYGMGGPAMTSGPFGHGQ